jgi:D-alanyl-D-alanine carboxypeptidase
MSRSPDDNQDPI